jgi:hypothetical protein
MNNSPFKPDEFLDIPEQFPISQTELGRLQWASAERRALEASKRAFMREFVLAMAKGGHSPNLEHTVPHARKLFDAIEAENGKE